MLKIEFALLLKKYAPKKSQMNPKKLPLHSQFYYHTLPVTPFKGAVINRVLQNLHEWSLEITLAQSPLMAEILPLN